MGLLSSSANPDSLLVLAGCVQTSKCQCGELGSAGVGVGISHNKPAVDFLPGQGGSCSCTTGSGTCKSGCPGACLPGCVSGRPSVLTFRGVAVKP